jgi:hypothetical protein
MFAVVIDRDPITPLVLTQSNISLLLTVNRERNCYFDPSSGKFFRIDGDLVHEIDGIPPRCWTQKNSRLYEES